MHCGFLTRHRQSPSRSPAIRLDGHGSVYPVGGLGSLSYRSGGPVCRVKAFPHYFHRIRLDWWGGAGKVKNGCARTPSLFMSEMPMRELAPHPSAGIDRKIRFYSLILRYFVRPAKIWYCPSFSLMDLIWQGKQGLDLWQLIQELTSQSHTVSMASFSSSPVKRRANGEPTKGQKQKPRAKAVFKERQRRAT